MRNLFDEELPEPRAPKRPKTHAPREPLAPLPAIVTWARAGMPVRCIDAKVRLTERDAVTSDLEKRWADLLQEGEVYTIREVLVERSFGSRPAIRLEEIVRPLELIRRYRAKSVLHIDRPFLLDRFRPVKLIAQDPAQIETAIASRRAA